MSEDRRKRVPDVKSRVERDALLIRSARLIAGSRKLRQKAEALQRKADALTARFKKDHLDD